MFSTTDATAGAERIFPQTTIMFLCSVLTAGSAFCIDAIADDAILSPLPPAMRNVLMWGQVEGGHMVDMKVAKSLNANVINVAAVPHGVGTWIGSVKPLAAYKMGLRNGWKADLDELNKAGIAVWTSVNTTAFGKELTPDRHIVIRVRIPLECDVASASALSPDSKKDRTLKEWKLENGKLSMTLDELKSYTVIVVDLKANTLKKSKFN